MTSEIQGYKGGEDLKATSDMHVDFVQIQWYGMQEELIERLLPDDPRAGKVGDYARYSEPHTMADCPFREHEWRSVRAL